MANYSENPSVGPACPGWNVIVAAVAGLAGALLAAGDAGLLGHALRHALTWVALGAAVVAGWPGLARAGERWAIGTPDCLKRGACLLAGLVAAVVMTASDCVPVNILAAPVMLGVLGALFAQDLATRQTARVLWLAGLAATGLGVYRLACSSIPLVWQAADSVGAAIGRAGGTLAGEKLSVGATFAGLDFLVLMGGLYAGWLVLSPAPRRGRAIAAGAFILAGHAAYLAVLAHATDLLKLLPLPPERPATALPWNQDPWTFSATLRTMLPWNLPALAGLIHLLIAGGMLRAPLAPMACPGAHDPWPRRPGTWAVWAVVLIGACLLPVFSNLSCRQADLDGKKIVGYEKGFVNWLKPQHGPSVTDYGHYSIGMYGMLPVYVENLGGSFVLSPELSEKDLAGADVVLMMYPNTAWTGDQLRRLHAFVRQGGSLLVFGEHTIRQVDGRNRFNDILELFAVNSDTFPEPLGQMADLLWSWEQREKHLADLRSGMTPADAHGDLTEAGKARARELIAALSKAFGDVGLSVDDLGLPGKEDRLQKLADRVHRRWGEQAPMQIPFDSGLFEVGGWLQNYDALAHPTTSGLRDDRNQFGAVIGASMQVRPPARPVLAGRYGWAEPGDAGSSEAMMRDRRFTAGERLGDIVLAAEQEAGKGRVFAFGDTSSITNGITIGAHPFVSRLLTYLAARGSVSSPQTLWRQIAGLLAAAALLAGLTWRGDGFRTAAGAAVLAGAMALCIGASYQTVLTLPDGGRHNPNNLAYIDSAHLELASSESWRDDGTMGLCLNLMRDGYETLLLPRETQGPAGWIFQRNLFADRLERAGLFISVAPTRAFSPSQRRALRQYVENGGIFILTVGYPESGPSRSVLEDFGFSLDGENGQAPQCMGHFKAPYVENGKYLAHVRFHAGWPVRGTGDGFQPIANGTGEKPVILMRKVGKGKVVVIGDTCFAMNKNLEMENGQPFEGMRENADFWRWFLGYLTDRQGWLPSPPAPTAPPPGPPPAPAAPASQEAPDASDAPADQEAPQ